MAKARPCLPKWMKRWSIFLLILTMKECGSKRKCKKENVRLPWILMIAWTSHVSIQSLIAKRFFWEHNVLCCRNICVWGVQWYKLTLTEPKITWLFCVLLYGIDWIASFKSIIWIGNNISILTLSLNVIQLHIHFLLPIRQQGLVV